VLYTEGMDRKDIIKITDKVAQVLTDAGYRAKAWIRDGKAPRVYVGFDGGDIGYVFVRQDGTVGSGLTRLVGNTMQVLERVARETNEFVVTR